MLNETDGLAMLVALAQESRLRVLRALLRAAPEGMAAGRLAAAVNCTPSTLSFHLAHLEKAGLVRSRRLARSIIYGAVPEALAHLAAFLTEECCDGLPERCLPPVEEILRPETLCIADPIEG